MTTCVVSNRFTFVPMFQYSVLSINGKVAVWIRNFCLDYVDLSVCLRLCDVFLLCFFGCSQFRVHDVMANQRLSAACAEAETALRGDG